MSGVGPGQLPALHTCARRRPLPRCAQEDGQWIQFDDDKMILRKEEEVLTLSGERLALLGWWCEQVSDTQQSRDLTSR